ncbi:MAG: NUDIX hydrolase [Pseudomonadota bacterium]
MAAPVTPLLATDCVVLDARGRLLVVRRRFPPFSGQLALPGGFVETDETVEAACRRELAEETGVTVDEIRLVGVYSEPGRDPRGPVASVAFLAHVDAAEPVAGDDAATAEWIDPSMAGELAFDHARIVADALAIART